MSHSTPAQVVAPVASAPQLQERDLDQPSTSTCSNCGARTGSRFCGECGQRVQDKRLSTPALIARLVEDVTDFDRGFLFTAWQLTRRRATVVREYLDGRRVRYTNPLRFLAVVAALTTVGFLIAGMMDTYLGDAASLPEDSPAVMRRYAETVDHLITRYFNLLSIAAAPFIAVGSYLLFKPARRTFAEHLVFNAYTYAHAGILVAGLMIVARLAGGSAALVQNTMILWFVYWIWAAVDFFGIGIWRGLVRGVTASILGTLLFNAVFLGGLLVYVIITTP